MRNRLSGALAAALLASPALCQVTGVSLPARTFPTVPHSGGNILVLLADDLGVDQLASYGVGVDLPYTPNLDALAASGVQFENAWSNPVCSPTRATIMTGRYSFRNGVGHTVDLGGFPLLQSELTLPEMLDHGTGWAYEHGAFGKWHLGNDTVGGFYSPNLAGFSHFEGVLNNVLNYSVYQKIENGSAQWTLGYHTSDTVDDTVEWVREAREPWFAYVSFNTPHYPWHEPPSSLHSVDLVGEDPPIVNPRPYYKAMVESMDHEIGRLFTELGPALASTTVIFLADNGTPPEVIPPPLDSLKGKGTLYEGGVGVPLIVSGPAVGAPGTRCDALVNTTDLFMTVADLAGAKLPPVFPKGYVLDSVSLVPYLSEPDQPSLRETVYAEIFKPGGFSGPYSLEARAIRNERFKLIDSSITGMAVYASGFYDLRSDPGENNNLLGAAMTPAQTAGYHDLQRRMKQLTGK